MLKEGMYVEFEEYNSQGKLVRKLGQLLGEKKEEAHILCHEWAKNRILSHPVYYPTALLKRAEIRKGTIGIIDGSLGTIIRKSRKITKEGYRIYYCASAYRNGSFRVPENAIKVQYDNIYVNPKDLFLDEIFADPKEYLNRYDIKRYFSQADIAPEEYESVIGKRIRLLEHQMETVKKVTKDLPIRAILADEVGLGKTIEALMILDYALKMEVCKRALIIVPDQLRYQWSHEAINKFGLDAGVFLYYEFLKGKPKHNICIISDADFKQYYHEFNWNLWDFVICDEVHRAIRNDGLYNVLLKMCRATDNLLLLSATPLLQKGKEMYRLLRLYDPKYYTSLGFSEFKRIMQIRGEVVSSIERVNNGFKMSQDLDHARKCIYTFRDVASQYEDISLKHLLTAINEDDEASAIDGVKLAFEYLDRRYEITPKYIRHRRSDILDPTSKRCLYAELEFYFDSYEIIGEVQMYQTLREEIEEAVRDKSILADDILALGNAFFSSASAMNSLMIERNLYELLPKTYKLSHKKQIEEENTLSNSRLETLVSFLKRDEEVRSKKTIIFTDYYETAKILKKRLEKEFGEKAVAFFSNGDDRLRSNLANNSFKTLKECNFLICDRSGAEGKNFQFADFIVHYDTPWIPTDIEQRIGRLDRIGRKSNRPVNNVVLFSRDTIEEDLFEMCKNDLQIYDQSLSGIEIVFDQITELIKNSISENALLGFDIVGNDIRELKQACEIAVQQEEFEQMCFQAENGNADKTQRIINNLTGEVYDEFVKALCDYHENNGYKVKVDGEEVYLEGLESRGIAAAKGTFSIEEALNEEDVEFLSASNPLIKTISSHAINNDSIKTTAVRVCDAGFDWKGFIATWELELFIREFFHETWDDIYEKIPNDYVDDSMMVLAESYCEDEYPAEYLLEKLKLACKEDRCSVIDSSDIEEELDYTDLSSELSASIKRMYQSFKGLVGFKFGRDYLRKDIDTAKREYKISQIFKSNEQNSKARMAALKATDLAMNDVKGRLDSVLFVVFEK